MSQYDTRELLAKALSEINRLKLKAKLLEEERSEPQIMKQW